MRDCGGSESIDTTDNDGRIPLSWATIRGDVKAVRLLLANGADYNWIDKQGRSILSYAARRDELCVNLLLEAGADVHRTSPLLKTALHHAPD